MQRYDIITHGTNLQRRQRHIESLWFQEIHHKLHITDNEWTFLVERYSRFSPGGNQDDNEKFGSTKTTVLQKQQQQHFVSSKRDKTLELCERNRSAKQITLTWVFRNEKRAIYQRS